MRQSQPNAAPTHSKGSKVGRLKERIRRWKLARQGPTEVFSRYYRKNKWGDAESRSGKGSNLDATAVVREELPKLVRDLGVKSFLDLPCGDYFWMQHVDLGVEYTGGDIVADMIAENRAAFAKPGVHFEVIDLIDGPIPQHDLVFVRDCLVHLSAAHIMSALQNIKASNSEWLLTTNFPGLSENTDIATGQWREINLCVAPYFFPAPVVEIAEGQDHIKGQKSGKTLGLWKVSDIPNLPGRTE